MAEPVERVLKRLSSFELKRTSGASVDEARDKVQPGHVSVSRTEACDVSPFHPAEVLELEPKAELLEQGVWERRVRARTSEHVNSHLVSNGPSDAEPALPACGNAGFTARIPLSGLSGAELEAKMDLLLDTERQLLTELRTLRSEFNKRVLDLKQSLALPQRAGSPSTALQLRQPLAGVDGLGNPHAAVATRHQPAHRPEVAAAPPPQHQRPGHPSNGAAPFVNGEGAWPALQSVAAAASAAVASANGGWMPPPPPRGRAVPRLPVHVGALLPAQMQLQPQRLPQQHGQQQHGQQQQQQQYRQLLQLQQAIQLQRAAAMAAAGRAARAPGDGDVVGGVVVRRRSGTRPC